MHRLLPFELHKRASVVSIEEKEMSRKPTRTTAALNERHKKLQKKRKEQQILQETKHESSADSIQIKANQPELFSSLKTSISCPTHLLRAIKRQTNLDEHTIHVKYFKFRMRYPAGFVGKNVLVEMCLKENPNQQDCEKFVETVFKLFGRSQPGYRGWGSRLIGFREVTLATENINKLKKPKDILTWIFRVFDSRGQGCIETERILELVDHIIQ